MTNAIGAADRIRRTCEDKILADRLAGTDMPNTHIDSVLRSISKEKAIFGLTLKGVSFKVTVEIEE